ncbi:MAG: hypothetical protein ACE5KX_02395 [Acidimicrobiia bacterium]
MLIAFEGRDIASNLCENLAEQVLGIAATTVAEVTEDLAGQIAVERAPSPLGTGLSGSEHIFELMLKHLLIFDIRSDASSTTANVEAHEAAIS